VTGDYLHIIDWLLEISTVSTHKLIRTDMDYFTN